MNALHSRAIELMSAPPGSLSEDERRWLARHLEGCPPCRELEATLAALSPAVRRERDEAPPATVEWTKAAMRRRIAERDDALSEQARAVIAACVTMAATSVLGAVWWGGDWLGHMAGLSTAACWITNASVWMLACLIAAFAVLDANGRTFGATTSGRGGGAATDGRPLPLPAVSGVEGGRR